MERRDSSARQAVVLAHLTESRLRVAPTDPAMEQAFALAALVTDAAARAPGFCWQLTSDHPGEPVTIRTKSGVVMISLSCWLNYTSLHSFVNRSIHAKAMRERDEWFEPGEDPTSVLWWIGGDARPTAAEGRARLAYLRKHGSSPRAFSLLRRYTPDGRPERTGRFRASP